MMNVLNVTFYGKGIGSSALSLESLLESLEQIKKPLSGIQQPRAPGAGVCSCAV